MAFLKNTNINGTLNVSGKTMITSELATPDVIRSNGYTIGGGSEF